MWIYFQAWLKVALLRLKNQQPKECWAGIGVTFYSFYIEPFLLLYETKMVDPVLQMARKSVKAFWQHPELKTFT